MRLRPGDTRVYRINNRVYIVVVEDVDERTDWVTTRVVTCCSFIGLTLHREYHHMNYFTVDGWANA